MAKTLGIDLGSNSLGWAVIDDVVNKITAQGVVTFPEGIEREKGNDTTQTPAATRRAYRAGRRLKFRRKMRKWKLLEILIREGMCPLTQTELTEWKNRGKFPLENRAYIDWLRATDTSNPYCDRNRAAEEKVPPFTLGRALYHIAQRRGFKSSRKDAPPDTGDDNENKKAAEKASGPVKSSIAALTRAIDESGAKTLGQYFYRKIEAQKASPLKERVRAHYTGRIEHYEKEFSVIMACQGFAPDDKLREELHAAIFMQRPLRSQRYLKGMCPLEPRSPRTFAGHPLFEEYRMLAFINNLRFEVDSPDSEAPLEELDLTAEDRAKIAAVFDRATSFKFKAINDLFKMDDRFKSRGWNTLGGWHFHYYKDAEMLPSCSVRHRLKKNFGDVAYDEQQVVEALMFYDDDAKLAMWFKKHYPALADDTVAQLVKIRPSEQTVQYSLKAIKRILPFLRKGLKLYGAALLAKLSVLMPDFAEHEEAIILKINELHFQLREARKRSRETGEKVPSFLVLFQDYLLNEQGITSDMFKKLYVLTESPYVEAKERIPTVQLGMIRNPVVQRALTTLRRLVNYLRLHEVIDENTAIRLEMAHSVNNYATRQGWTLWQKKRQEMRLEAKAALEEQHIVPNDDAIERYLLWDELSQHIDLYTGMTIEIADLFRDRKWDIEHIIPRSRSGDDSLENKTLCEANYNQTVKKGNIPRDCPKYEDIDVRLRPWREKIEQLEKVWLAQKTKSKGNPEARAKALAIKFELEYWRNKLRRFEITSDKLTDPKMGMSRFKNRQLVDTGVMTTHAVELLKSVYNKVYTVNGAATAFARKAWGLQASDEAKDRTNHTHHAKDAMVIAALTPTRFNAICAALKDDGDYRVRVRECDICPPPWQGFSDDVRHAAESILIKHVSRRTTLKQSSKQIMVAKPHSSKKHPGEIVKYVNGRGDTVRGQLHAETFYGCIQKSGEEVKAFVVRKPLEGKIPDLLKTAKDIVDPAIRDIVETRLKEMEARGAKIVEAGAITMPSGVPIKKVRIYTKVKNPFELRMHATPSKQDYKTPYYVTAAGGSNFRMGVYEVDGKLSVVPDNSLDWAQNHKKADYVPLDKRPGFRGFIYPGSLALTHTLGHPEELRNFSRKELAKRLYKVVKYEAAWCMTTFRLHTESRASTVLSADLKSRGKHKAGESKIDLEHPHELLLVAPSTYLKQMQFEGIHFKMMLDGTIQFL